MSRVQLALNVDNLDESIAFYAKLFNAEPTKIRPGYANFAITEPPLKLVLLENPGQGGSVNHLGVEVADVDAVDAEQTRLAEAGFASIDERGTTCCYAKQDKFWVDGTPNGERWEIYTVLADSQSFFAPAQGDAACCGTDAMTTAAPAANHEGVPMTTIRVYEPALCCNTGVCGPDVDEALVTFTADLNHLQALGADIERRNLANDPTAFAGNDTVRAFLQVAGSEGLPLTLVDGITVSTGSYPTRALLLRYAGLPTEDAASATAPAEAGVVPDGVASLGLATKSECGCAPSGCC